MGKGRRTRRALERGGTGPAQRLNETLASWPRVRITPMFGRWGYFVGETLFACFPVRDKERDQRKQACKHCKNRSSGCQVVRSTTCPLIRPRWDEKF